MPVYLVEHLFDPPIDPSTLPVRHDERVSPCLHNHSAKWLGSYFSDDFSRGFCLYEAPEADSIRRAYRSAGTWFNAIWAAQRLASPMRSEAGQEFVVEERFAPPVEQLAPITAAGLQSSGVSWVASLVAVDGTKARRVYLAADADAVRQAYRSAAASFERVWASKPMTPPD